MCARLFYAEKILLEKQEFTGFLAGLS